MSVDRDTIRVESPPSAEPAATGRGDGLALALSSVIGSLAGFVSWLIVARVMPLADVGRASAFVSAFILVASCAQLHVGVGLLRWLPAAGRHSGVLLARTLAVLVPLSVVAGLGYATFTPALGEIALGRAPAAGTSLLGAVVFGLAAVGWCLFVLQDFVLVGIGRAWWTPIRNAGFAVVRVGLVLALGTAGLGATGVVLSWLAPIALWAVAGAAVIAVQVVRVSRRATAGALPSRAEVVGFIGPTAVAHIGVALLFNQVPLLVTLRFGPEPGAAFFIAWQAIIVVDTAATFFTSSLSAQIAREPDRASALGAAAGRRMFGLFLPALAIGVLVAGPILSIFGPAYAEATGVLRLLLIGLAFRLVVLHELGIRQAVGRAMSYARLQLVSSMLVLVPVMVLPVHRGPVGTVLTPVALAYILVQLACAAAVLAPAVARRLSGVPR
ncbi:lipopolysaccharide biosynthesis protein [Pseudonocardia acidicola]|uniref:O-antigen/teichoic acid export membrane protein n=1 Tax=Pseudonocardia acidicola TaxID=2724939 RepID=A0ABX1S630_9PSEU|nr:hypothetical protein [Pseudonocardia acidicola]NMH97029.1 hypothetical protein [Pseudonocardia acidicola]